jgi:membrane-bound lytic murein transglycosylase D
MPQFGPFSTRMMSSKLILPLTAALLLASIACEPDKSRKSGSKPPVQANAPTIKRQEPQPQESQADSSAGPSETATTPQEPADRAQALIARVEKEYQAGQANYHAGHLDAARENFDRAFNLMVESNLDIRNNQQLQDEFDKLVERVHNLEAIALEQGDGFTAQSAEPAPIDEANAVTFPVDPNIRAKAEAEIRNTQSDLPLMMTDQVASYINYFSTRGRASLESATIRKGRYEAMIRRIFKEEGVPQDLIYLAEAESGFLPMALSHAGARGMWQFMASRSVDYGLVRNWWLDERQDPEKSTRAAARHLKDLYAQFGDWYLAMAAYNSGPGNVQQAVQRTGYADFWELYKRNVLPAETKNYVPIILAFTIIAKNPAQYGLEHLTPDPPQQYDKVKVDYPIDLRLVAECVDSTAENIQALNPALLRMTTPKEGSYELKLPAGTTEKFQTTIAAIPRENRVSWRYHRVKAGENLTEIARQYHTTAKSIAEVNEMSEGQDLRRDTKLIIPISARRAAESTAEAYSNRPTLYKVRKGDTVLSVADDFGVPAEKVRRWNHLRGNALKTGQHLRVYRPVAHAAVAESKPKPHAKVTASRTEQTAKSNKVNSLHQASKKAPGKIYHKVKPGETLTSIAERYKTTVAALRKDNARIGTHLRAGDVVVVRVDP